MGDYCKVLIIDDEFIMRQGIKHMLDWEKEGFQIVGEATNGQEGLELIEKMRPDIVLADIVMPVLDGIEFSKKVSQRYPDIQLIILSSYDKFEYVKATLLNGAADYILKPTLNPQILLKTLNKVVRNIPGLLLEKDHEMSPASQIERYISGYQERINETILAKTLPYTLYRLAGINLKVLCDNYKSAMGRVFRMLEEFFEAQQDYETVMMLLEEEILCIAFNYRIKEDKRVLKDIESCAVQIKGMYEQAFVVTGQSFSSVQDIRDNYEMQIRPYVNQKFYYPEQCFLMTELAEAGKKENRFAYEEYAYGLMHRQYKKALGLFREYAEEILRCKVEEYRLKNLIKNLLYNYLIEIERYEVPAEELKKKFFVMIEQSGDVFRFREILEQIFLELQWICEEKTEIEDKRIIQIKEYIEEHYAQDLAMSDLVDTFGFSYHYLSSYFNRQTKEGFSEYLNKVRIEKSRELLMQTDMTIAEVSNAVGYGDQSYFCRVFKKHIGQTPSAYRRNNSEEDKFKK